MYNYLRELHRIFGSKPDCTEEQQELDTLTKELRDHLGEQERILLLEIIDIRDVMDHEISLESFAAGFRLAYGMTRELEFSGRYSYDEEETKRICQGE